MSFTKLHPRVMEALLEGRDLFLQIRIPNNTVKQHTSEVAFLQHRFDAMVRGFNKRIKQGNGGRKVVIEDSSKMSNEHKTILLKMGKDKKKEGGGTPL